MGEQDGGTRVGGVRNADLYDKFRAYCQAAATTLNSKLDESGNREEFVVNLPGFILQRTGSVEPSDTKETNWRAVLRQWHPEVKVMNESMSVVQALKDDATVARHLGKAVWFPGWGSLSPGSDTWADSFLIEVLDEADGQYQDAVFDRLYKRMEAFFYEDQLQLRILAPLGGFTMQDGAIDLGDRLRIVRLTQEDTDEMARAWNFSASRLLYSKPWLAKRRWGFELYLEMDKRVDVAGPEPREEALEEMWMFVANERFNQACSALRVCRRGDVWHDLMLGTLTSWHPSGRPLIGGSWNLSRLGWEEYTLTEADAAKFVKLWKRWGKAEHWQDLEVAVRRFSMGCERSSAEDRLIDYVIALEALLLPDEKIGEYRYRLSLRGAALLGKDPLDRAAVKRNLAEAYDCRSSIVHGSKEKPETVSWRKKPESGEKLATDEVAFRDFVDYVSDYLRDLIEKLRRRVEEKNLVRVLQEDIDDDIAKGFATRAQR